MPADHGIFVLRFGVGQHGKRRYFASRSVGRSQTVQRWNGSWHFIRTQIALDAPAVADDDSNHFSYVHRGTAANGDDGCALGFLVESFSRVHAPRRWIGQGPIKEDRADPCTRQHVEYFVDDSGFYQSLVGDNKWFLFAEKVGQMRTRSRSVYNLCRVAKIKMCL